MNVFIYLLSTMADWETGFISAELNSRRYFKMDAPVVVVRTAAVELKPVKTMGGFTMMPDCTVDEIPEDSDTVLILPGADEWNKDENLAIIKKAEKIMASGGTVCAICGATTALAKAGLLDDCRHTSNGPGFLEMFAPEYKGTANYVDEAAVASDNLITAGATGSLEWAKLILKKMDVIAEAKLEAWYNYFRTGKAEYFYALY